jgi:hypothetical protein
VLDGEIAAPKGQVAELRVLRAQVAQTTALQARVVDLEGRWGGTHRTP